jgi:hypothetical protein
LKFEGGDFVDLYAKGNRPISPRRRSPRDSPPSNCGGKGLGIPEVEVVLDFFFFVGLRKVLNANPRINAPFEDSFVFFFV